MVIAAAHARLAGYEVGVCAEVARLDILFLVNVAPRVAARQLLVLCLTCHVHERARRARVQRAGLELGGQYY